MFINDLFENKNVKEGWDEVKSRVGDVAKKTADTLVSAGAAAGDAVGAALNVIPRPFDEKTYQDRVSKPYPKTDKKLDEEDSPEIGSTVNVTTVKGRTYTGELVRIDDNSVALRVYATGGIPHAQDDTESRSQIIVIKKDHVVSIEDALEEDIPPPENARKTQIASTLGTYKKAGAMLDKAGIQGKSLDFGAGLGKGTAELGKDAESYEPYPREDFKPNYIDATQIPSNSYSRIVNLNVLNVVPNVEGHRIRDEIVRQIGRVLAPGGMALITTRGRDVLTIKGTPGEEPMSMISSIGTYQKGFTSKELKEYVQSVLGDDFEVSSAKLGPAGVMIKKHKESVDETAARDRLHQRHQEIRKQAGRPHPDYYKELKATFDLPDDERWAKVAELKKKYKVAESLRDGEHHTWTVHFDDGTSQQVNVPSDEFDVRGYFAKKGKKVIKVDKSYAVQGQQQDKVKPDNYDDRPDRAAKAQAAYDRDLTEGDDKFSSMMSKIASPESMDTSEALALIDDLMHQAGASYQEAVQQASVSYGIKPAKLNALYKQRESRDAFDGMFGGSNPASNLGIKEEQLDELSPKTLMSYSGKAHSDAKDRLTQVKAGAPNKKELISKAEKRVGGIKQAHSKVKDPEYGKKVVDEDWSNKYKRSIDCSNPKGFSQKAHCAGRKKNEDINEDIERYVEALTRAGYEITEDATLCPECGGPAFEDKMLAEKQDACYHKVKSRYKVWPSAYASGALVRCRKAGAKNWGNKSKK
jgi:small nuclear ribonucleoprotein (snRNP)-like protein